MSTLDLRRSGGTLRLTPNGGSATVRSFLVLGPKGDPGPPGLPGVNAIPANDAVAAYITTPGPTVDALAGVIATRAGQLTTVPPATQQAITSALISNGILQSVSDLTGYTHVWLDQVGKIALGITVEGKVVANLSLGAGSVGLSALGSTVSTLLPAALDPLTGFAYALVDSANRYALAVTHDGQVVINKFVLPAGSIGTTQLAPDLLSTIQNASPNPVGAGRRIFELALAERFTRPVSAVWIGGSSTAGLTGQNYDKFVTQIERMMVNSWNPSNALGAYTMKVRSTGTGGNGQVDQQGLKQAMLVTTTPRTITEPYPCDGIELTYLPTSDAFTVKIDAGAPIAVTPDATGKWTSPVLTFGLHTFVLTSNNTSAGTTFDQIHFNNNDRTSGVRIYNGALAGTSSPHWLPSTADGDPFWLAFARIQPDFMPITLGPNDINDAVSATTFGANLQTIITKALSVMTGGKKLWVPIIAQQSTQPEFPQYVAAMKSVAAANPTVCTYHSFYEAVGSDPTVAQANAEGIWLGGETTPTHMSPKGNHFAASVLATQLQIPSRLTWPTS